MQDAPEADLTKVQPEPESTKTESASNLPAITTDPYADNHRHRLLKFLSLIGLLIAVGFFIATLGQIVAARSCEGAFCGLYAGFGVAFTLGISLLFLVPALTGLVVSSKSYRDKSRRSIAGISLGVFITILSLPLLYYSISALYNKYWVGGLRPSDFSDAPVIFAIGVMIALLGLRFVSRSLRLKSTLKFLLISILVLLTCLSPLSIYGYSRHEEQLRKDKADFDNRVNSYNEKRDKDFEQKADFSHTQASTINSDPSGKYKIYTNTYFGISITYPSNWTLKKNDNTGNPTTLLAINSPETIAKLDQYSDISEGDLVLTYENFKKPVNDFNLLPLSLWHDQRTGKNTYNYIVGEYSENINSIDFIEYDMNYFRDECFVAIFTKGDYVFGLGLNNTLNKAAMGSDTDLYNILHSVKTVN